MKTTKKIFKIMSFLVLSVLMLTLSVFGSGAVADDFDTTSVSEETTSVTEETTEPEVVCPDESHEFITETERATLEKDGYKVTTCKKCGYVYEERVINRITKVVLFSNGEVMENNEIVYDGYYHYVTAIAYDALGNEYQEYDFFKITGTRNVDAVGTYKLKMISQSEEYDISETISYSVVGPEITQPVLKTVKSTKNGVQIIWEKSAEADGYYLYRKDSSSAGWKRIKKTTKTEFTDTDVEYNKEYSYTVKAYKIISSATFYSKYDKKGVAVKTKYVLTPTAPTTEMADYGIKITWSAVPGATKYYVYRAESKNGTYERLGKTKSTVTSYADKKTALGKTYYYKVKAYADDKGSSASPYTSVKAILTAPVINKKLTANGTSFTFSWNKNSKADGYFIYQTDGKTYTKVAEIKNKNQNEYTYKTKKLIRLVVTAYFKNEAGKKVQSAYSEVLYANSIAKPKIELSVSALEKTIYVISGVKTNSYQLYYKEGKNGSWKLLEKGNQYGYHAVVSVAHSVNLNKTYYYKIRAVEIKANNTIYGEFSEVKSLTLGYISGVTVTLPNKNYDKGKGFEITVKNSAKKKLRVHGTGDISNDSITASGTISAMGNYIDIASGKSSTIRFLPIQATSPVFDTEMPAYKTSSKIVLYFTYDGIEYASVYNCKTGKVFK